MFCQLEFFVSFSETKSFMLRTNRLYFVLSVIVYGFCFLIMKNSNGFMLLFLFNIEFCCHIPLLIYTVKFHFLVNPILTGSIVIEQWIEFGFEMVITVRFQYNANVVHQTVVM